MWRAALAGIGLTACGRISFDAVGAGDGGHVFNDASGTVAPGLLLRYDFETSVVHDSGAAHHDATCSGPCPALVPSQVGFGQAASFDGTTCLQIDAPEPALMPSAFTISLWADQVADQNATLFTRTDRSALTGGNTWEMYVSPPSDWHFGVNADVSVNHVEVSPAIVENVWHHTTGTYDGNALFQFIDTNKSDPVIVDTATYTDSTFFIGCDHNVGANEFFFTGLLDEVRFYDHVLSDAEIAALGVP